MSGCLCPECGSPYLDSIGERCERWSREVARKRSGAYFVVLVRVGAGRGVAGAVSTALGVDGFRVHRDGSLQAEVGARPSGETLSRLRAIAGVTGVEVV